MDRGNQGGGLWKAVDVLNAKNKEEWFRNIKRIAIGMDVQFLMTDTLTSFSTMTEDERAAAKMELNTPWVYAQTSSEPVRKWWTNPIKVREWSRASASFMLHLDQKLSIIDQSRIEACDGPKQALDLLYTKYYTVTHQLGAQAVLDFTGWKMNSKISPSDNWLKLHIVRRDAHRQMGGSTFDNEFTTNTFLRGLVPFETYETLIDGFTSSTTELAMLQKLDNKWELVNSRSRKERSFLAAPIHRQESDDSESGHSLYNGSAGYYPTEVSFAAYAKQLGYEKRAPQCFKCGSGKHISVACAFATVGFEAAKAYRIKSQGAESDEEKRIYQPAIIRGNKPSSHNRARPDSKIRSPLPHKSSSYARQLSPQRPKAYKGKNAEKSVTFESKAYLTDASSSDESEEFAGISWEKRSEIPTVLAAADTGCTSHMTDQRSLFTSSLVPCKRSIRVGGGRIWSSHIGTATISPGGNRHIFLSDTLLVPELGCTLVSARKLAGSEYIGQFDDDRMVFSRRADQKHMIEAKQKGGLYIVSRISKEAHGTTFYGAPLHGGKHDTNPKSDLLTQIRIDIPETEQMETAHPATSSSNNMYDVLEDEGSSLSDEDMEPVIERHNDHIRELPRRERNKLTRQTRKPSTVDISENRNQFTLKERRVQRELARYVHYHRRFCHAGPKAISLLHTVSKIKKITIPDQIPICETCSRQKIHKRQSKKLATHAQEPLALISFDVAGPFPTSYRGYRYFGEIIDNWTRKTWTILLKDRKEVLPKLTQWKREQELATGRRVRAARTDNAPEILETLQLWNERDGIEVQTTEPYTSAQNGPAERSIQTTEHNVRAMIDDAELPVEFWCEAAEAQAYTRARMRKGPKVTEEVEDKSSGKPLKIEYQISPEEAYCGRVPRVHNHIKTWGCKVIAHVARESLPDRQDKLMPTGREGIFMGYDTKTTAHHRVYAPDLHRTIISSNVRFFEDIPGSSINNYQLWIELTDGTFEESEGTFNKLIVRNKRGRPMGWRKEHDKYTSQAPTVDSIRHEHMSHESNAPTEMDEETVPLITPEQEEQLKHSTFSVIIPSQPTKNDSTLKEGLEKQDSKPQDVLEKEDHYTKLPDAPNLSKRPSNLNYSNVDPDEEHEAKRIKVMLALLDWFSDDEEMSETEEAAMIGLAAKHDIPIPTSYKEAVNHPTYGLQWRAAIGLELVQLMSNKTWEESVPPPNVNLISSKWVFTIKFNPDGSLERFKARLVARGFSQQYGVDYTETFAPTVRMATLRAFFAMVACEDLECRQFDIKNAFTESKLSEELWMKIPQGVKTNKSGTAMRLMRSLYGLKQSARDWNLLMKGELLQWGFQQSKADPCLFVHPIREIRLLVYVDDLAAAATQAQELNWFFQKLSARFNTKDLGNISKILGIRITRNRTSKTLELDQEQYINKFLTKFGFPNGVHKPISSPIDSYEDLRPGIPTDNRIDATWYREVIGSVMYAMVYTRPDIAFALGRLSQHMQDPCEHHGRAVRRMLRYLKSSISTRISFGPKGNLVVYSDADYATDKSDRKSITASIGLLGGGPVFWASKKQVSVATATTEAEYVAMSFTAKQGQWIAQILRDLGVGHYIARNHQTVDTRGDNQGAIALAKNPHLTERSKHIDISYHLIRDLQERKRASVTYVPTAEMAADGLSKPLVGKGFEKFKSQIGMIPETSKLN